MADDDVLFRERPHPRGKEPSSKYREGGMDKQLQMVAESQAAWSATANELKARYERTRWQILLLSIGGALLAATASQLEGKIRVYLAIVSAVLLALVSFLTARRLGGQHAIEWARIRAASEALKREAYKYAACAAPYDDADTRGQKLHEERQQIEKDVDDLIGLQTKAKTGSTPVDLMIPAEYLEKRVKRQIEDFFEPRIEQNQALAKTLRRIEFGLALVTTCITAIVGVAGKDWWGLNFDFVALTAVLTTISGVVLVHVEAARYDFIVTSYRATARRLRDMLANAPDKFEFPSPQWSAFVNQCETILSEENNSWIAKFSKPS